MILQCEQEHVIFASLASIHSAAVFRFAYRVRFLKQLDQNCKAESIIILCEWTGT